jgi:hypothetical protein
MIQRAAMIQKLAQLGLIALCGSCVDMRYARYDESQYELAMTPAEEQVSEHLEVLEAWSDDGDVPPGILAEYAYYLAWVGRADEARQYFLASIERNPEQATFVESLMNWVLPGETAREGADNEEDPQ